MELTTGIFKAAGQIYTNNRGSILRTIIYTIGHFAIAIYSYSKMTNCINNGS